MKRVITASLNRNAYQFEEDAYARLEAWLASRATRTGPRSSPTSSRPSPTSARSACGRTSKW
jgi:hypothetical protein